MEKGIKIGDKVIYTDKAKKEIKSVVDDKIHIVKYIYYFNEGVTPLIEFEDGSMSDIHWLKKV